MCDKGTSQGTRFLFLFIGGKEKERKVQEGKQLNAKDVYPQ